MIQKWRLQASCRGVFRQRLALPRVALIFSFLGVAGMWLFGRFVVVTVTVHDNKSGDSSKDLIGSVWDPSVNPIAVAIVACLVLSFALKPIGRRILGAMIMVFGIFVHVRILSLLVSTVDHDRAYHVLTSGVATQRLEHPVTIAQWAHVVDGYVHSSSVFLGLLGATCVIAGGVMAMIFPGSHSHKHSRYQRPGVRRAGARVELADTSQADKMQNMVMWDALDAGLDPTEEKEQKNPRQ